MTTNRYIIAALAALLVFAACGRKGDLIVPGTVLPEAPASLAAEPGEGGVLLAWTMPDKNTRGEPLTDLAGFDILRAELPDGMDECPCDFKRVGRVDLEYPERAVIAGRRVAWPDTDPGVAYGTRYAYKVTAVNSGGFQGAASETVTVRPLVSPAAPAGLKARPGNMKAVLEWEPVGLDVSGGPMDDLAGYNLYRRPAAGGPDAGAEARVVNREPIRSETFVDDGGGAGLENGKEYRYTLTALRGAEPPYTESAQSAEVSVLPADTEPPAAPQGLRAVPGDGFVLLSWDPNTEPDLKGYLVYRKGPGESAYTPLVGAPLTGITYKDAGVEAGASYTYAVSAVDDAAKPNESPLSDAAGVLTPVAGAVQPAD